MSVLVAVEKVMSFGFLFSSTMVAVMSAPGTLWENMEYWMFAPAIRYTGLSLMMLKVLL